MGLRSLRKLREVYPQYSKVPIKYFIEKNSNTTSDMYLENLRRHSRSGDHALVGPSHFMTDWDMLRVGKDRSTHYTGVHKNYIRTNDMIEKTDYCMRLRLLKFSRFFTTSSGESVESIIERQRKQFHAFDIENRNAKKDGPDDELVTVISFCLYCDSKENFQHVEI